MRMCAMSQAIREKPRWWEKIKEPDIMARWRKEALEQQESFPHPRQLTEVMVRLLRRSTMIIAERLIIQ